MTQELNKSKSFPCDIYTNSLFTIRKSFAQPQLEYGDIVDSKQNNEVFI